MKKNKHTDEQTVRILWEADQSTVTDAAWKQFERDGDIIQWHSKRISNTSVSFREICATRW